MKWLRLFWVHYVHALVRSMIGYIIIVAALGTVFCADAVYRIVLNTGEWRNIVSEFAVGLFMVQMARQTWMLRRHYLARNRQPA